MRATTILSVALAMVLQAGCSATAQQPPDEATQRAESIDELMRLGEASARIGDMTRAEQYFVMAKKLGADEKRVVQWLLTVCTAEKRYPVAIDYAESYLRRHPGDMQVPFAAASIHAATGKTERARELLETVLEERPRWAEAHYALATVLRNGGEELARADQHDLQYLKLAPEGPQAEIARSRLRRRSP